MISSSRFDGLVIVPEHQFFMNRDRQPATDGRKTAITPASPDRTKDTERQTAIVTSVYELLPSTVFPSDRGTLVELTRRPTERNRCWRIRLSISPCDPLVFVSC